MLDNKKENNSPYFNIVYGEEGTNKLVIETANEYWNEKVPDNIKKAFIDNGWTFGISYEFLHKRFNYDFVLSGYASYVTKQCFLDNRITTIDKSLLHEIGHALDCSYNFLSMTPEWKDIYKNEKSQFVDITSSSTKYNISNQREYFANVFENVIKNKEICKINTPRSYEFMIKFINSL